MPGKPIQQHNIGTRSRGHFQGGGTSTGQLDVMSIQPQQHAQTIGGGDVVFDYQHAEGSTSTFTGLENRSRCMQRGLQQHRQLHREYASFSHSGTECFQPSFVHLYQVLRKRQTDAQSAAVRPAEGAIDLRPPSSSPAVGNRPVDRVQPDRNPDATGKGSRFSFRAAADAWTRVHTLRRAPEKRNRTTDGMKQVFVNKPDLQFGGTENEARL